MKIKYRLTIPAAPGSAKLMAIRLIRIVAGLGLKEAKDLVDGCPMTTTGEREIPTLRADDEEMRLFAGDLERTVRWLEREGCRFALSLAVETEIGNLLPAERKED
jgi:hypothetical protein